MPIIETRSKTITVGIYTFFVSGRRIIVKSAGQKDEAELKAIAEAYKKWRFRNIHYGRPLSGEFRWCKNPECNNAFYALRFKIEQDQGSFCSRRCSSKITGCQKGQRIAKRTNKSGRLTEPEIEQKKRQRERVKKERERPIATNLPTSRIVTELGDDLHNPREIKLQCLKCKATMNKIPGNPAYCPVCKELTVFIAVASQRAPS